MASAIACPSCNRRVFTRRDMLHAVIDGAARCRSCGGNARLDTLTRWVMSCALAISLPLLLLFGGVFYSGHLFVISMFIIFSAWAVLSVVGFPFLTLEAAAAGTAVDRSKSVWILAALFVAALLIDGYMRTRFE
jgi:hypothetical protein